MVLLSYTIFNVFIDKVIKNYYKNDLDFMKGQMQLRKQCFLVRFNYYWQNSQHRLNGLSFENRFGDHSEEFVAYFMSNFCIILAYILWVVQNLFLGKLHN